MFSKKKHFLLHAWHIETGGRRSPGPGGYPKWLNMWTLYIWCRFYIHCLGKSFKVMLLRLGCHLFSSWYYIDNDSICTTGKVLKLNCIYSYKEGSLVDRVRLFDVHIEKGYLYCSLLFFSKNKIITVCQTMQKDTYTLWRLLDNAEFDELFSMSSWQEIDKENELLEFDF